MEVYCKECIYIEERSTPDECLSYEELIGSHTSDYKNRPHAGVTKLYHSCKDKNKNNDCEDFKPKLRYKFRIWKEKRKEFEEIMKEDFEY